MSRLFEQGKPAQFRCGLAKQLPVSALGLNRRVAGRAEQTGCSRPRNPGRHRNGPERRLRSGSGPHTPASSLSGRLATPCRAKNPPHRSAAGVRGLVLVGDPQPVPMKKVARVIKAHPDGLLNAIKRGLTNAVSKASTRPSSRSRNPPAATGTATASEPPPTATSSDSTSTPIHLHSTRRPEDPVSERCLQESTPPRHSICNQIARSEAPRRNCSNPSPP